jgi:Tol biopolymer transport system component
MAATARVGQEQNAKIIFISTRGGERDLYALDTGNGRIARLTEGSDATDDVVVSRDGSRVAFQTLNDSIEVVDADGRSRRKVPQCSFFTPSFSPDGSRLACEGHDEDVLLVDLGGSGVKQLVQRGSSPAWSPDGRLVAFHNENNRLTVIGTSGGDARPLTSRSSNWVRWSPDSGQIAFESRDALYVVNADGSGERRLLGGELREPAWSPDGRTIALILGECCVPSTLALVDVASGGLRRIARRASSPSWSPSGTWIVFERPRGTGDVEDADLYAIRRDGKRLHPLTKAFPDGGWNRIPTWVPGSVGSGLPQATSPVVRLRPRYEVALRMRFDAAGGFAVDGWRAAAGCALWDVHARRLFEPRACREGADAVAVGGRRLAWLHDWCSCNLESYTGLRFADPPYRREHQAVFSATENESGKGEVVTNLVGDGRQLAFNVNRYSGKDALRGRQLWTIPRQTRWPRLCPESFSGLENSSGSGRFCVRIRAGDNAAVLDLDRGRILALRDDGPLILIRADGRRLRRWRFERGEVKGAALSGSTVVVTTDVQLRVYAAGSGALRASWQLGRGLVPARVKDAFGTFAVYVRGGAVHLVRLRDGRDVALYAVRQSTFVDARLERPGLYYAYNKIGARKPGRIAFVPRARLPKLAARGRPLTRSSGGARRLAAAEIAFAPAANSRTYRDAVGDVYCCTRDVASVVVANDDAGMITFTLRALDPHDVGDNDVYIDIDADRNRSTGLAGAEYRISGQIWSGRALAVLGRVSRRGDFVELPHARVRAAAAGDVFRFTLDRHLLADTARFRFQVALWEVAQGGAYTDAVPEGDFTVKIALGRLRPKLSAPGLARAGHVVAARLALRVAGTSSLLASGRISCRATAAGRRLRVLRQGFLTRRAFCSWRIPRWATGEVVRGSIGVFVTGRRSSLVSRSFRWRVT